MKNALCLDVTASQAVMATSFDEMFNQKYCGAKGTDLCATVADKLVVVFLRRPGRLYFGARADSAENRFQGEE